MMLVHALHLKLLLAPEHEPVRCWPLGQLVLEQVVHVPCFVGEAPCRNWPGPHVDWSLHLKSSDVPPQLPVRNCEPVHVRQVAQVPLAMAPEPFRYSPALHTGWLLHE